MVVTFLYHLDHYLDIDRRCTHYLLLFVRYIPAVSYTHLDVYKRQVYGSVFGNEELLNPLYKTVFGLSEKPVEVMTSNFIPVLLVMAVGLGAVLIVISIGINLYLQIKNKNYGELFFSQNGIAGLVFYISLVGGGAYQLLSGVSVITNPVFAIVFLLVPLVLIFLKEALERKMEKKEMFPDGFGGFFVESFFELFEICLSFITNTISYLRVGGFVLSHAGRCV